MTFFISPDGDPVGRTEADLLRAEADIPIEELVAKYGDGMTSVPARKFMKDSNEKFLSPMIKAKRTGAQTDDNECEVADKNNSASSSGLADSLVTRLGDKLANGHADNENNLNTEKELREAESVNSNETEAMETNTDTKKTNSIEDSKENCIPDSSDVSNSVENVNDTKTQGASKADSSEADSTSVNDSEANAKPDMGERSESKEDSTPSSSSDGPSGSGCQVSCSDLGQLIRLRSTIRFSIDDKLTF